jgi:hypothetical protein
MTIAICGSLTFAQEILEIRKKLEDLGHSVFIPLSIERMLRGEVTLDQIEKMKADGSFFIYAKEFDAIKNYFSVIQKSDAILVCNYEKNNILNYIGGNSFLEMGFAHVLDKKIYILNELPEMAYLSEIKSMNPIELRNDLGLIEN